MDDKEGRLRKERISTQGPKNGIVPAEDETSEPQKKKFRDKYCTRKAWTEGILDHIPSLRWFPRYKWKEDLLPDFSAGLTLAFINVPQGLAFSVLAQAPLISGLYTACFSSFVYSLLGTAPVSAFGPVAVGSMLTGESVATYMTKHNMSAQPDGTHEDSVVRLAFISTLTFTIGLIYLLFYILQLSAIRALFTKAFVASFISGCCVHILSKSFIMVLRLKTKSHYGMFTVIKNFKDLVLKIPETHTPTLILSIVVCSILISNTFLIKKLVAKVTRFVLPIEAVVLIVSVIVSYFFDFPRMGIETVGHIPSGLPNFTPLDPNMFNDVITNAVTISTINYATSLSMVIAFNPNLRANQETLAMAASNLICSNIQCITIGNSMMRTIVAINLGIRTQMATIISSLILFFVLLFAGPLFEPLPKAVLGCIIITSIGQLLITNLLQVPRIMKSSIEEAIIWVVVFTVTAFADVGIGLIAGFILTLRQLLLRVTSEQEEKEKKAKEDAERLRSVELHPRESQQLLKEKRRESIEA